ncbi:MAG TPA: HAMP domain-containing sensor histidine kinase [Novosphingobium sp.]|nr:HAMP domain-containing sensor histidine kinase [Novosphingobium sp.]HZV09519.1 HAMP domain-containing sensor histidine kinase [Novosphingobium sp.]
MIRPFRPIARSMLLRILLIEALTFLAACIALPLLTLSELRSSAERIQAEMLMGQAQTLRGGLAYDARRGWTLQPGDTVRATFDSGYDGRAYALMDGAGHPVSISRYAQPRAWPGRIYAARAMRFEAGPLTGLSLPVAVAGQRGWLVVTQDQGRPGAVVDDVMRAFLARYLVALIGLLMLMLAINGLLLWHTFRGLRAITRQAAEIGPRAFSLQLGEQGLPSEIRPLVQAINGLLARVHQALHQQDEFAGNVAHELRTPLAALRLRAEQVVEPPLRQAMALQVERMGHVLSQLRDLAALEGAAAASMAPVDLGDLAVGVVAELSPRILAAGRTIELRGEGMSVLGNAGLLAIALANLIENAAVHTPVGTHITVALEGAGVLAVIDNGHGILEEDGPRLLRRFHRADHARTDGAGLGLSIVQRIADAHRARLEAGPAAAKGARFAIRFGDAAVHGQGAP